jgi:1-aminocyclopropane-1-carboxylate deaminase/D-cysteine desulfhydrase-like pyridoxal-dependent ACC family enzyme
MVRFHNIREGFVSTPIEEYEVRGRRIFVKRDDLFGLPPLPPLGKLRGLAVLLERLTSDGFETVGCWDTRVSKLGQGVAVLVTAFPKLRAIVGYPQTPGQPDPTSISIARCYGAEIYAVRGNFPRIAWSQVRRVVEMRGGAMLPFGLDCQEAVEAIAAEARCVATTFYERGTVVVSAGSGVTTSGLILGLQTPISKLIAVSSGRAVSELRRTIIRYVGEVPAFVDVRPPIMAYGDRPHIECPFPSHPNYDLKAWKFMADHLDSLADPILFWNIGA